MVRTAFVYTDDYVQYQYSDTHPLKPHRLRLTRDLIQSYGLLQLSHSRVIETESNITITGDLRTAGCGTKTVTVLTAGNGGDAEGTRGGVGTSG